MSLTQIFRRGTHLYMSFFLSVYLSAHLSFYLASNDKKFCLLCSMYQELFIIWSLFVVHKCKMIISLGIFFRLLGGSKDEKWPKMTTNSVCHSCLISQEPDIILSLFMLHMCKRIISPGFFTLFPNFNFQGQ